MTQLDLFKKLMAKAEANGYVGPNRWRFQIGRITDGTNFYAIIFREDFAKAIWGEGPFSEVYEIFEPSYLENLKGLVKSKDKWEVYKVKG